MKRLVLTAIILSFMAQGMKSQDAEITPLLGYALHADLRFMEGRMELQDKANVGINFSFPTYNASGRVEFLISNSFAQGKWIESDDYANLMSTTSFNMMVSYFQASWVWETEIQDELFYFLGGGLGLMNYSIATSDARNVLRVSGNMQTGLKYYFNNGLGFRAQGQLVLPVFMGNGTHFRGITDSTGVNSYLTVNSTTFPVNFLLNVGIFFRIRNYR